MQWTDRIRQVKIVLVVAAIIIAVVSLMVSNFLVEDLSREERTRMEVWAQALHALNNADESTDLSLVLSVIQGNNTIPVIVLDSNFDVMDYRNIEIDAKSYSDSMAYIARLGKRMYESDRYIKIVLSDSDSLKNYQLVCYDESIMLKRLFSYPYVQLGGCLDFCCYSYFCSTFFKTCRAEQSLGRLVKRNCSSVGHSDFQSYGMG